MNAMIVGADRLGNIPKVLADFGIQVIEHVTGRNAAHQRRLTNLACNADLLILFTDFLGHNVMKSFRELARREGLQVIACKRSVACIVESLACRDLPSGHGTACETCPRSKVRYPVK